MGTRARFPLSVVAETRATRARWRESVLAEAHAFIARLMERAESLVPRPLKSERKRHQNLPCGAGGAGRVPLQGWSQGGRYFGFFGKAGAGELRSWRGDVDPGLRASRFGNGPG